MTIVLYFLVPLFLMLLFHYGYFKFGQAVVKRCCGSRVHKVLFWSLYIFFGFVLVYTNYIWKSHRVSETTKVLDFEQALEKFQLFSYPSH